MTAINKAKCIYQTVTMADTTKTEEELFQEIYESTGSKYTIPGVGTLDAKKGSIHSILSSTSMDGKPIVTLIQDSESEIIGFEVEEAFPSSVSHYNETIRFNRFVTFIEGKMLEKEKLEANLTILSKLKTIVDRRHREVLNLATSHLAKDALDRSALLLTTCIVELSNFIESSVDVKACTATSGEELEQQLLGAINDYEH